MGRICLESFSKKFLVNAVVFSVGVGLFMVGDVIDGVYAWYTPSPTMWFGVLLMLVAVYLFWRLVKEC